MARRTINGYVMDFPRDIEVECCSERKAVHLHVRKPAMNMQKDPAAFEGWLLILKANGACDRASISFAAPAMNRERYFNDLDAGKQHYMRFLYRLVKFKEQFGAWFSIDQRNVPDVALFENMFSHSIKTNTIPTRRSRFNTGKGDEHLLEKAFVAFAELRRDAGIEHGLSDQLPTGLFAGAVRKEHKIFNTGYFDLWSLAENGTFTVYELKAPGNLPAGIISELYFYANYANDLLRERNGCVLNRSNTTVRNYGFLSRADVRAVNGVFLVNRLHPEIEKQETAILSMLNAGTDISYSVRRYRTTANEIQRYAHLLTEQFHRI